MTEYAEIPIGDLFHAANGRAKFIKDYIAAHPGPHPVYSASLTKPFGHVDEFEYRGTFLTWVMNGYGGRVQEVTGHFSANRDRGVFIPQDGVRLPDLTYLRFAMEPQLVAAAMGRRVDGRLNEYTKIYPETAMGVVIRIPLDDDGQYDYEKMFRLGAKFRRIEAAQKDVRLARDALLRAAFPVEVPEPAVTVSLSKENLFALSIGARVLVAEHVEDGVPAYSANALVPFGNVRASNLRDFSTPSILWGIDGNFDWNLIRAGKVFATTDHCGRLQILDDRLDPEYVYWFLAATRDRYGFDRVYRASLDNMKAEVTVTVPLDKPSGTFSLDGQRHLAQVLREREAIRKTSTASLYDVLRVRVGVDL
ncbi:MAG: hypothetical protein WD044_10665 [Dongiaceae bacterium]